MNKLKVMLRPDTLQSSYMKLEPVELHPVAVEFNDGSLGIRVPDMKLELEHRYCTIDLFAESIDDLMVVAQIKDVIERLSKSPKIFTLRLSSTLYSRYDRVMFENQTDAFGAKVFAEFVNALGFDTVYLYDCHSNVMVDLIKNACNMPQHIIMQQTLNYFNCRVEDYCTIAPDKGATKKLVNPGMVFGKLRDVTTGQILETVVEEDYAPKTAKKYIVIDDICEGGRTFIELAKVFEFVKPEAEELALYVTHGIFSGNAIPKLLEYFDKIYVHDMKESTYTDLDVSDRERVFPYQLIED